MEKVNLVVVRRHYNLNEKHWARLFALFVKMKKGNDNYIQPCQIEVEAINPVIIGQKLQV